MSIVWAILFIALLVGCWVLTAIVMPGNWLMVLLAIVYKLFAPQMGNTEISWWIILALLVLATIGELLEFAASAMGATRVGGSRRGALLAILGSVIGGVIGMFVGIPIPVVGSIIAGLMFASVGALLGAMLGETWKGRNLSESWNVGQGAFWGRLLGTFAKLIVGGVMVAVATVAVVV